MNPFTTFVGIAILSWLLISAYTAVDTGKPLLQCIASIHMSCD